MFPGDEFVTYVTVIAILVKYFLTFSWFPHIYFDNAIVYHLIPILNKVVSALSPSVGHFVSKHIGSTEISWPT